MGCQLWWDCLASSSQRIINTILSPWVINPAPNDQKPIKAPLLEQHSPEEHRVGLLGCPVQGQESDFDDALGTLQPRTFHGAKKGLLMDVLKPRSGAERVGPGPVCQHRESCPSASTFQPAHFLRSRAAEQQSSEASSPKFVMFCLITVKQQHAHSITGKMRVGCFI